MLPESLLHPCLKELWMHGRSSLTQACPLCASFSIYLLDSTLLCMLLLTWNVGLKLRLWIGGLSGFKIILDWSEAYHVTILKNYCPNMSGKPGFLLKLSYIFFLTKFYDSVHFLDKIRKSRMKTKQIHFYQCPALLPLLSLIFRNL
jgi:hypothetical protein